MNKKGLIPIAYLALLALLIVGILIVIPIILSTLTTGFVRIAGISLLAVSIFIAGSTKKIDKMTMAVGLIGIFLLLLPSITDLIGVQLSFIK